MARYIDVDEVIKEKFKGVEFEKYSRIVSDNKAKTDDNVYAFKVGWNQALEEICRIAPTADVQEVRHGEWIYAGVVESVFVFKCSCCHAPLIIANIFDEAKTKRDIYKYKYCQNCGAKMDGGINDG